MDTPNNKWYKTFLVLHKFYFRQCLTVLFRFSSIFISFLSQFNGLFKFIKWKFVVISSLHSPPWLTRLPVAKDAQSAMGQGLKHGYNYGDFCSTCLPNCSLQWDLVKTTAIAFFFTLLVGPFTRCKQSPTID